LIPTVSELRRRWYGDHASAFEIVLDNALLVARNVLVFGAGRGLFERDLRGGDRRVTGVDVHPAIRKNPHLDAAVLYDGVALPFESGAFDLCVARWVIEHLPKPQVVFQEVARVVRGGGRFVFLTMNAFFYAAVIGRLVPNRLHGAVVSLATGREACDTFNTYYRANTRRSLRRVLGRMGFREEYLRVELGDPSYLQFSVLTYAMGAAFHRIVTGSALLEDLGQAIIGSFVRE
jgi:SAM-dependent methyltransferase